ncbi:MAG TPA: hypothetical protein VLB67_04310 [Acidimicrobiia bacterium]|nr:hypothetical protein [Acidimicrobiia bacterium]
MGQTIEINRTTLIGKVLMIDTDRTLAGQDGEAFGGIEAARRSTTFPGRLAVRIFEHDSGIDHVFVMSNQVSLRRFAGWDDESVAGVAGLVAEFFRVYPDDATG